MFRLRQSQAHDPNQRNFAAHWLAARQTFAECRPEISRPDKTVLAQITPRHFSQSAVKFLASDFLWEWVGEWEWGHSQKTNRAIKPFMGVFWELWEWWERLFLSFLLIPRAVMIETLSINAFPLKIKCLKFHSHTPKIPRKTSCINDFFYGSGYRQPLP